MLLAALNSEFLKLKCLSGILCQRFLRRSHCQIRQASHTLTHSVKCPKAFSLLIRGGKSHIMHSTSCSHFYPHPG